MAVEEGNTEDCCGQREKRGYFCAGVEGGLEELGVIMDNGRGLAVDRQANLPPGQTQERCVSLLRHPGPAAPAHC